MQQIFLKRFTFAQTEAEAAGNTYSEEQLVSFALAGFTSTYNTQYKTALQLYHLEREQDSKKFTLAQLEKKFFSMDKQTARDNALTRIALGHAAQSHRLQHGTLKRGKAHKQQTKSCHQSTRNQTVAAAKSTWNTPSSATTAMNQATSHPTAHILNADVNKQIPHNKTHWIQTKCLLILNDVYVTLHFEAYDFIMNNGVSNLKITSFIHNKPDEEDLLDFAMIVSLDLMTLI